NKLQTHPGSLMILGPMMNVGGPDSVFTNEGIIQPGGMKRALKTDLSGSFVQTSTGLLQSELDFAKQQYDQIVATGTASVAGRVDITLLNAQLIPSGHFVQPLFSGALGATNNGLQLTTPASVVVTYKLDNPTGKAVALDYVVDFSLGDMSRNLTATGDHFNAIQAAGSSPALASTILKLVYEPDVANYHKEISQISPDFYGEEQAIMLRSQQRFSESLLGHEISSSEPMDDKGNFIWLEQEANRGTHDGYLDYKETAESSSRTTAGVMRNNEAWTGGIAFSSETGTAHGYSDNWTATTDTSHVGIVVKREINEFSIAANLEYGWNRDITHRRVDVTTPYDATSTRYLEAFGGTVRAAYDFERVSKNSRYYLRPLLDFGVTQLRVQTANEQGSGSLNLTLPGRDETHRWLTPRLEAGLQYTYPSGFALRFFANGGIQRYLTDPQTIVVAHLQNAPVGTGDMQVPVELGEDAVQFETGLEFISSKRMSLQLGYHSLAADRIRVNSASLDVKIPF
ncbi:MAG TPA: autotransporter outer membrane beta-barrel domain-containing protein, partial [Candidatus Didemnitutus sp.]|nr:autotransporter outer membrane beta-barrel domain-containing protein [Candidatus Didemnitutus sp.]